MDKQLRVRDVKLIPIGNSKGSSNSQGPLTKIWPKQLSIA